ncbi:3-hydroxyacyl-CoA dehydrogenase NAD-binding domain-containing protein [Chelativorans sp. AA-79]|uniref:3-hydroxyacyl-CoA dehydrogenase NAD-binding domain-containing protein n=1 Tax=Chelativorans sp. AA-79 TaxID=3028735 RepID=UPI0023F8550F|nr:3-hydroxyacyl-CoA dehydrogenase NAD-binding domain-containing protein [Chelativorans sp. AA-79]WEX08710.1 3-hydroxyacyl-CoA dehydrogenase NAD-binding domain-containing protein [Chelativorans sp. AA-79]
MNTDESCKTVRVETRSDLAPGRIAVVTIDNPPVNAGSLQVRRDLLEVFARLRDDDGLAGVVLTGANGNFVAGSDIREFDAPPQAPHLPEVIAAIESLPVPVVAAIDGAALGGGYELALGCDARLATPRSIIGLPEVTLGLIPGAGGTQRLPRLVGIARAISLITSGRRVKAQEACLLGMIDAVAEGDVVDSALEHLKTMTGRKRVVRELAVASNDPEEIEAAEREALARAKGAAAVPEAIAAVKASAVLPAEKALYRERETSLRLRVGPQAKALRHLFFSERQAARPPEGAEPLRVSKVGVVGAGRMGQGIALAFMLRGFDVRLSESDPAVLESALAALRGEAEKAASRGRVHSADELMARLSPGGLEEMSDRDLVIEAITEDMAAKKALLARLDGIVRAEAVLASNTSYLDLDEMAAATSRPERVGGLHFFNPAHIMRLVEIVRTENIAPATLATLISICKRLGKVGVVARVGEGFIGNRIFSAYRRQCEFLLEEGCLPQDVDRAMVDFGMAMGPFAVFDLAGLDIAWATRKRLAPKRDPRMRYVEIPDILCNIGRFGRKTGKGWYDYSASSRGAPDPDVQAVIEAESERKGIERRAIGDDEIRNRLLAAIVNEAALVLAEGIAERAGDIDLVLVHGYGFPALAGGPLHWAARMPRDRILASVDAMAAESGFGAERAFNLLEVLDQAAG